MWWNSFGSRLTLASHLPVSLQSHMAPPYSSCGVSVRLAFALCFVLFLFVCGAAAGWSRVHRWSTQFLCFGFFHFVLNGLDVKLAFCGSCNRNEVAWLAVLSGCTISNRLLFPSLLTFTGSLHQRLLLRRNESFVPFFLLLGECLRLLHLQK